MLRDKTYLVGWSLNEAIMGSDFITILGKEKKRKHTFIVSETGIVGLRALLNCVQV